jgi:TetR/AcrR family transcriptional repressor of nem operon
MSRTSDKRRRLVEAAKHLIHRKGFHNTTLADIAAESRVPLGNVYYYFKTKEELCEAVLDERKRELTKLLDLCCQRADPKAALRKLVQYAMRESRELNECGCPYAALSLDLDRADSRSLKDSGECIRAMTSWAADQFRALGHDNAKEMGFEFISRLQGTILVGHVLHDPVRIRRHMAALCDWIDALEVPKRGAAARAH